MSPAYIDVERMICHCLRITESQLDDTAAQDNICSLGELMQKTGAGTGCTACRRTLRQYLLQSRGQAIG